MAKADYTNPWGAVNPGPNWDMDEVGYLANVDGRPKYTTYASLGMKPRFLPGEFIDDSRGGSQQRDQWIPPEGAPAVWEEPYSLMGQIGDVAGDLGIFAAAAGAGAMLTSFFATGSALSGAAAFGGEAMGAAAIEAGGAGAAAGGSGGFGSMVSSWINSGVSAIQNVFSGATDAVSSISDFFTSAVDAPWGVNTGIDVAQEAGALGIGNAAGVTDVASTAANAAGVSTDAARFLQPAAEVGESVSGYSGVSPAELAQGGQAKGLIDNVLQWGKENPALASGAMQLGGGLLKGIGDNAMMDKKIAAEKEIAAGRSPEAVQAALRAQAASSGAFGQKLGFSAPNAPRQLRRPDGTIVFVRPGLINGAQGV